MGIRSSIRGLFSADLESPRVRDYKNSRSEIMRRYGR